MKLRFVTYSNAIFFVSKCKIDIETCIVQEPLSKPNISISPGGEQYPALAKSKCINSQKKTQNA